MNFSIGAECMMSSQRDFLKKSHNSLPEETKRKHRAMLAQGEEDNENTIILQKNHPHSMEKGMKHVHVKCFAVDEIQNEELKVTHCPMFKMAAGCSSKPLQGKLFADLWNEVMGIDQVDSNAHKRNFPRVLKQCK